MRNIKQNDYIYPTHIKMWGGKAAVTFRHIANFWDDEIEYRCYEFHIGYSNNALPQKCYTLRLVYKGKKVEIYFTKKWDLPKRPLKVCSINANISILKYKLPFEVLLILANSKFT